MSGIIDSVGSKSGIIGTTELGTVTSGNLSNSAIVYPAGSVVQVVGNSTNLTNGQSTAATLISQAITIVDYVNNDILITVDGLMRKSGGGTGGHGKLYITGGSLGSTTSGFKLADQSQYLDSNGNEELAGLSCWDLTPPSASQTYGLYLNVNSSLAISHRFSISIYEIKR